MPRPIVTMGKLAVSLDELADRWLDRGPDDMKGLCLNVASIEGGVAFNVVPNQAALTFSIRPAPGFDPQTFEAEVMEYARRAHEHVRMRAVLTLVPFANRDPAPFRKLLGDHSGPEVTLPFWTEAAAFSEAGIDAVVIGPGDIAQAHAPDEFVTKSDLEWAVNVFKHVLETTRAG